MSKCKSKLRAKLVMLKLISNLLKTNEMEQHIQDKVVALF
jgi:hypothetical protein